MLRRSICQELSHLLICICVNTARRTFAWTYFRDFHVSEITERKNGFFPNAQSIETIFIWSRNKKHWKRAVSITKWYRRRRRLCSFAVGSQFLYLFWVSSVVWTTNRFPQNVFEIDCDCDTTTATANNAYLGASEKSCVRASETSAKRAERRRRRELEAIENATGLGGVCLKCGFFIGICISAFVVLDETTNSVVMLWARQTRSHSTSPAAHKQRRTTQTCVKCHSYGWMNNTKETSKMTKK